MDIESRKIYTIRKRVCQVSRLFKARFSCSYGSVGITVDSVEKLEKAFSWFQKNYPDAKIDFIEEVFANASK